MSNNRQKMQKDQMSALYNEVQPYITGELEFNPNSPPAVSNAALKFLRTCFGLLTCKRLLENEASRLSEHESLIEASTVTVCVGELLEAIGEGKNHPLLDYWEYLRTGPGKMGTVPRNEIVRWRRKSALAALAMKHSRERPGIKAAQTRVAELLVQYGAHRKCTWSTIKNWMGDLRPMDAKEADYLASVARYGMKEVEDEFVAALIDHKPLLDDLKRGPNQNG